MTVYPDRENTVDLPRQLMIRASAEAARPGRAHLQATWEILDAQSGAVVRRGSTERFEEGWVEGSYDDLVRLLDATLNALAANVGAALQALGE